MSACVEAMARMQEAMIIILMGVAGCGKTRVGRLLAGELGWQFHEGDEYHPQSSIDKMARGEPLGDDDRWPWLDRLHTLIAEIEQSGASAVLACSALRQSYRDRLAGGLPDVRFVLLKGDYDLILHRIEKRENHYMKPSMLASQFAALEEPAGVLTVSIDRTPEEIVETIRKALSL